MSDQAPPPQTPPSWFKSQETNSDPGDTEKRRAQLLAEMPTLLERQKDRGRAEKFQPYLLVRSVLGDRGDRPINVPFWESPDIWTAPGAPASSPAVPPSHGGTTVVGQPATIYAHVWNLGFAPLAGVAIEFYVFDPSLGIDGAHAGPPIGVARCELSGRGMAGSHQLVKCPNAWVPVMENGGHECLVVRVSGIGDPVGGNPWSPWLNRHVGQRNVSVVAPGTQAHKLIAQLDRTRLEGHYLQLIQVGPKEGGLAARLVAPGLKVAPQLETHLLGEMTALGGVVLSQRGTVPAGMFAPVHAMAHGVTWAVPSVREHGGVAVLDPVRILRDLDPRDREHANAVHLADLLGAVDRLHGGERLGAPPHGEAYVLRMATYQGDQLVGGYTLVIG